MSAEDASGCCTNVNSEEFLQVLSQHSLDLVSVLEKDGTIRYHSPSHKPVLGYAPGELIGKNTFDFVHPEDVQNVLKVFMQAIKNPGITPSLEFRFRHKDGTWRFLEAIGNNLLHDPKVAGVVVNCRDITRRKLTEDVLRQERQRLQVLLDPSPVGIIVVRRRPAGGNDRQVVLFNKELARLVGFEVPPSELLSHFDPRIKFLKPDGTVYALEERPLERALFRGETTRAEEMVLELSDGRRAPVLMNASPMYAQDGEPIGAVAIVQDMAPLQELEELRNAFLSLVTHELKTPLTAIKGSAAIVLGSQTPFSNQETRELFQIIDEQVDKLRDLVNNILDMTRIETGSLAVSLEPVALPDLLEEARTIFARSGGSQDVQWVLPAGLPKINADPQRITQVLTNLLSNAGKFSPTTAPITIGVERDDVNVTVHVKDTGRGITKEKLPHLFKKFSRVHEGDGPGLSGSGLGLAICKGIVEAHGGRIWVDSPGEGQGANFSFTLPVAVETRQSSAAQTTRRAEHLGHVRRPGERARILAVDDEAQVLRYLQRHLDQAGYQTFVTSDPSNVTSQLELQEPDLVLLDAVLSGTSGFDLLQQIRKVSGVPVIFLSSRDQTEDSVRALNMGADDYITKPFSPTELLARIEAALRRRVLQDTLEARPPFVLEDLSIDFAERRVTVGGRTPSLSATEYKLLYELATHAGRVLTHDQVLHRVWGPEYAGEAELVRSFIRNLRRKLGDDARNPRYIFTEPQVGYRMPRPGG